MKKVIFFLLSIGLAHGGNVIVTSSNQYASPTAAQIYAANPPVGGTAAAVPLSGITGLGTGFAAAAAIQTNTVGGFPSINSNGKVTVGSQAPPGTLLVGIGDSLMSGTGGGDATGNYAWIKLLSALPYLSGVSTESNFGVGGTMASNGSGGSGSYALNAHPIFSGSTALKVLALQYGSNDAGNGIALATYQTNMLDILSRASADGVSQILVCTVTDRYNSPTQATFESLRASYNIWLRSLPYLYPAYHISIVDFDSYFPNNNDTTWYYTNGTTNILTHLNPTASVLAAIQAQSALLGSATAAPEVGYAAFPITTSNSNVNNFASLFTSGFTPQFDSSIFVSPANNGLTANADIFWGQSVRTWDLRSEGSASPTRGNYNLRLINNFSGGSGSTEIFWVSEGSSGDTFNFSVPKINVGSSASVTVPTQIIMDNSSGGSNAAGATANLKLVLLAGGDDGLGLGPTGSEIHFTWGNALRFYSSGTLFSTMTYAGALTMPGLITGAGVTDSVSGNTLASRAPTATPIFTGDVTSSTGNVVVSAVGKSVSLKGGTNAASGTFTLSSGAFTVATTAVTANSVVHVTVKTVSGTRAGNPDIVPTAGTGFTATGAGTDNSTYNWWLDTVNQ